MANLQEIRLEPDQAPLQLPTPASFPAVPHGPHEAAELAFTDFRTSPILTTEPQAGIAGALQQMKQSGTRLLFVVDAAGGIAGTVTSYDIQGEKPMRHLQSMGCTHSTCAWSEVTVADVMEPTGAWTVIDHRLVPRLTLGEISAHLADRGLRYLVVVERTPDGTARQLRGLFSAARIQQLLGDDPLAPTGLKAMHLAEPALA